MTNDLKHRFSIDMALPCRSDYVSFKALVGSMVHAACIVQPAKRNFSSVELGDMIHRAGVNKLHTTAAQISAHIRDLKHNANLLHRIIGLDEIIHHTPLNREDEEWLVQNRIPVSVSSRPFSLFSSN